MRRLLIMASLLTLGGCAGTLPEVADLRPVPDGWSDGATIAPEVEDQWWLAFGDPVLNELVALADRGDDPAIAEARLSEAVARLGSARARLSPELSASGQGDSSRVDDLEQDQIVGLLGLVWSPDPNGARAARENAAAAALSAETARTAAVRQATRATAVRLYIAVREAQARATASDISIAALSETLALVASRERAGLASGLDPVAAGAELAAARVRPAQAREAEATARLGLEALVGLPPGALSDRLGQGGPVPSAAGPDVRLAPARVMARRPDLIAAEHGLIAAGYEAEAARRDFWPDVSLSAALGVQSFDPETPGLASGGLGQVSAELSTPLLSFGRLEAARDVADARRQATALAYRQAVTQAFAEVERAAVAAEAAERRKVTLIEAERLSRDRVVLANSRYRGGLTTLLDVLVANDAGANASSALASAKGDAARAYVSLCVALGLGGASL